MLSEKQGILRELLAIMSEIGLMSEVEHINFHRNRPDFFHHPSTDYKSFCDPGCQQQNQADQ
jgi:hypothetical protein